MRAGWPGLPVGTVGGALPDSPFVSIIEDDYPASTYSRSWRLRSTGKYARILRDDVFYFSVARWSHDRLLALRARGARRFLREKQGYAKERVVEPVQVVARTNEDVWVVAQTDQAGGETLLLRIVDGAPKVADLDDEDARAASDATRPAAPTCASLFASAGEPTPLTLDRIKAARVASGWPIVIATVDGKRVVGSSLGGEREAADELMITWRKLALPAELRCGRPPVGELVLDPDARDE